VTGNKVENKIIKEIAYSAFIFEGYKGFYSITPIFTP